MSQPKEVGVPTPETPEPIEAVVARDASGWAQSLYNCTNGSNYLRASEYYRLIRDLDEYARENAALKAAASSEIEPPVDPLREWVELNHPEIMDEFESGGPKNNRQAVKEAAYKIDPECWISYSGKEKKFKQEMDRRRTAALEDARRELGIR